MNSSLKEVIEFWFCNSQELRASQRLACREKKLWKFCNKRFLFAGKFEDFNPDLLSVMEVASLSVQNICYSSVQGNRRPQTRQICENTGSHSPLWRPWILTARDMDRQRWRRQNSHPHMETANQESVRQTIPSLFTHPVRLLWPRNKCFDYLYSEGQELLAAFPVQASISFYMESDSEEENEELDEGDELEEESAMEETVSEKITEQKSKQL